MNSLSCNLPRLSQVAILSFTLAAGGGFSRCALAQTPEEATQLVEALKKPQPWTDKTGRVFLGTPSTIDDNSVVFLRSGGQKVTVKLDQLSDVSRVALHFAFHNMKAPAGPTATSGDSVAPMTPAATAPTAGALEVADTKALRAALNTEVTVTGKVKDAAAMASGHGRVSFSSTNDFILYVPKRSIEANPNLGLDTLKGTNIQASGKVVEYGDKLEIVIDRPEQIVRLP